MSENHDVDLTEQIKNYRTSINAGNQVIVIAHSQGNFFTNEAYNALSPCEQKSFYMLGTANPANHVSGMDEGRGALATLDNDPITFVPTSMGPNIINDDTFVIEGYSLKLQKYHLFDYYRYNNNVTQSKIDTFPEYAISHYNENNPHISVPIGGIIDIKLSWGNPSIHMNLSSEIGTKDISSSECRPFEHYYVKSEEDVEPGRYGVYVSNTEGVDEIYLPQSVNLNIHAPGAVTVFDFNITAADMLNLGHVADIVITENKQPTVIPKTGISNNVGNVKIKCYGDCKNSEYASGTYQEYLYEIQSKLKQALLGPLSDANVTLTKAENFMNNISFYESSTSGGNSLTTSGVFYFTNEVIGTLESNTYYVTSIIGGDDIDANDDGELDAIPTLNTGTLHAIVNTDIIANENFKVNILTEIAFQLTQEMLNEDLNSTALQNKLDNIATKLLKEDVNGDTEIDYDDLLAWVPIGDKDKLVFDYEQKLQPIVEKIYKNEDIYFDVYKLLREDSIIEIDYLKSTNNIEISLTPTTDIEKLQKSEFTLTDNNGINLEFTFNIIGEKLVISPLEEFIEGKEYTLSYKLEVENMNGDVYIDQQEYIFAVPDTTPPKIIENTIYLLENNKNLKLNIFDPSSPLKYTINDGLDKTFFNSLDAEGQFSFKNPPNYENPLDHNQDNIYELNISIADSFENITTQTIQIVVTNLVEEPVLESTEMFIDENVPIGTYVGSVTVIDYGDGNITEFSINSNAFRIDNKGNIYTEETLDYERQNQYMFLTVRAKNSTSIYGGTARIKIYVNDTYEAVPQIYPFTGSMDEEASVGKVVGQLYIYSDLKENINVELFGEDAEHFDINSSGYITVSGNAQLDHTKRKRYDLTAVAKNSAGESEEANVTIYINEWTKQSNKFGLRMFIDGQNNIYTVKEIDDGVKIYKFNTNGEMLWEKEYLGLDNLSVNSMIVDVNATIYLACTRNRSSAVLVALSSSELLWSTEVGLSSSDNYSFKKIILDNSNNIVVAGETNGALSGFANNGRQDTFLMKISNMGDILWKKQYGSVDYNYVGNLRLNSQNKLYFLTDSELMEIDQTNGDIYWKKRLYSLYENYWFYCYDFVFDSEDNIYIAAQQEEKKGDIYDNDIRFIKLDNNGVIVWDKLYGSKSYDEANTLTISSNNILYLGGLTLGSLYGNYNKTPYLITDERSDFFLISTDTDGNMIESKQYGSVSWDFLKNMAIDTKNNIYLMGIVEEALDGNMITEEENYNNEFLIKVPY
ncbi:cadherin repeat domain-containing protein [Sulfurimonas microaerophilic]|uniref:cadherin repeat domain-containing protein n=1 Tax=Sulfurimonas microaerophilic TaxID=3058392 RepID=UPI00271493CA|nr:cadherin repeat domain-containing protein [Sulfurimonas sp. hsl 1-7]